MSLFKCFSYNRFLSFFNLSSTSYDQTIHELPVDKYVFCKFYPRSVNLVIT